MYSGRIWLGSVALSGVLLFGSMPGLGVVPTAAAQLGTALSSTPTMIGTQAPVVSKQLEFTAKNVATTAYSTAAVKPESTQVPTPIQASTPTKEPTEVKKAAPQRPVQVAKAEPAKQLSRGGGANTSGIVTTALSLKGVPYVFGGTSRSGFDCSGFTQYVYKASGISIPRTSYTQFNSGSSVSKQDLQPGDLVFFTTYSKGASHVGIYIGNGTFVHASDSGVRTTSLNESYYKSRYLGARRVK